MKKTRFAVFAAVVLLVIISLWYGRQSPVFRGKHPVLPVSKGLTAILAENGRGKLRLDPRTGASGCATHDGLPDHACTPGAVFTDISLATMCGFDYTKSVRNVPTALKRQVYEEYGLHYPQARGAFEADHLIPLELGGDNDIANLWPEAAQPALGFAEKDLVEGYLHDEVCAGNINLAAAQQLAANDWLVVFNSLSPDEIKTLRAEFPNWSDRWAQARG